LHTFKTEYAQAIWQSDVEKSIHHLLHKYHMIFTIFSDSNFSQEIKNTTNAIWSSDNQDLERERLKIHIHQFSDEMIAQLQARISAK
jgi:hypothetical protein